MFKEKLFFGEIPLVKNFDPMRLSRWQQAYAWGPQIGFSKRRNIWNISTFQYLMSCFASFETATQWIQDIVDGKSALNPHAELAEIQS